MVNRKPENMEIITADPKQEVAVPLETLIALQRSVLQNRLSMNGTSHEGSRDLYSIFGYKKNVVARDFAFKYQRGDIAARVVTAYPDATWSNPPEIIDDEDSQEETEFESKVKELFIRLKVWHYLCRADILSQLGRYSVLVVGVGSSGKMEEERKTGKVAYLMPYGEVNCEIKTFINDPTNERFGKPELYQITIINAANQLSGTSSANAPNGGTTINVHHSRALHFAERLLDNDIYGRSILENIYNRLDDLEKVVGGASEVYWLNSRGGLNLNADKEAKMTDPERVRQDADDYVNQLSRVLRTQGIDVKPLKFDTDSPKDQFECIIALISGATGIPKRILLGSEAGQLASVQDDDNWLARVNERRKAHSEPMMLRPIIDLFIETGDLPNPKDGKYTVKWPDLINTSDEKKADIAVKKSQAISAYVNAPGGDMLVTPKQFVEEILEMTYLENEIAEIEKEHELEDEELRQQAIEDGDLEHQRSLDVVKLKAPTTTAGVPAPKVRITQPGNGPVKNPSKATK